MQMKSGLQLLFLRIHDLRRLHFVTQRTLGSAVVVHSYRRIYFSNFPLNQPENEVTQIENVLRSNPNCSVEDIERGLHECDILLTDDVILNVLQRHRSGWKPAFAFFTWACGKMNSAGCFPGVSVYNECLDILGRMKRFDEFHQVLDEMRVRENFVNERTYAIAVGRLASAHKVDDAIKFFEKIQDFGLERNLAAFQTLLLSLCRYKHVEEAELLFRNRRLDFGDDIKTWNIILNGWCVLRCLPDAKRVWRDIVRSECSPDKFTYGIFVNCLSKSGKITTAMKLLRKMWDKECNPDTAICNTVIDGLCFKKRIPEALQIFNEMNSRGCPPNVATYNSLIMHMCKIQRMEKVAELMREMQEKGGACLPNALTYGYLLQAAKTPEQVDGTLEMMEKSGCKLQQDLYNLLLRLFIAWGDQERVKHIWDEMEKSGSGPDQRSYAIIIHSYWNKGMVDRAMEYYSDMTSKGLVPERKTKFLVEQKMAKSNS